MKPALYLSSNLLVLTLCTPVGVLAGEVEPVKKAAVTVTEWNFNAKNLMPSIGSGSVAALGTVGVAGITPGMNFTAGDLTLGGWNASSDPADLHQDFALQTGGSGAPYPDQGTASEQNGVEFRVSTVGYSAIGVAFDIRPSRTASRFLRFQFSTDNGATWQSPTFPPDGVFDAGTDGSFMRVPFSLVDKPAVNNNENFRFRVQTCFLPFSGVYLPAGVAGGYDALVGTIRYDMVSVTAEQTTASRGPIATGSVDRASVCPGEIDPGTGQPRALNVRVYVTPGTSPSAAVASVVGDFSSFIGGLANQSFVLTDGWIGTLPSISPAQAPGVYSVPVTVTDTLDRTTTAHVRVIVSDCSEASKSAVKIRQVHPMSARTPSAYSRGFVELKNNSSQPVFIGGWYLQSTSSTPWYGGLNWGLLFGSSAELTIPANGRYLIATGAGQAGGIPLPTPDARGTLELNPFNGVIALSTGADIPNNFDQCTLPSFVDLLGYGFGCAEGNVAAHAGLESAMVRKQCGFQDTGDNLTDFENQTPDPKNSTVGFSGGPSVVFNPTSRRRCPAIPVVGFTAQATSTAGEVSYQWQAADASAPGGWRNLAHFFPVLAGPVILGTVLEPTSATMIVTGPVPMTPANVQIRCRMTDGCGTAFSEPVLLSACAADYNCANGVGVQDLFDVLAGYLSGDFRADINGSGTVSVQDLFDFLAIWFVGC